MKFSENKIDMETFSSLIKEFRLSSYIAASIIFLVILSTLTISSVLYFSLQKSLTTEFEERIKAEGREVGQVLSNRFKRLETSLKALTSDNTIRVTLMLGARGQLEEHLQAVYTSEPDIHFFIEDVSQKYKFSVSNTPFEQHEIWTALSSPSTTLDLTNDMTRYGFKLTYTLPITRQQDRIGTAAAVYIFKMDSYLKSVIGGSRSHKLVNISDGAAWDMVSGEVVPVSNTFLFSTKGNAKINYLDIQNERYISTVLNILPNLFLLSNIESLEKAKSRVLYSVMFPAFCIIVLSLFISFYLSKRLSYPLRQLTDMALAITKGNTNFTGVCQDNRIIEYNRLRTSLNSMLSHLEQAREMERYQELFEGVGDIVFIHDINGKIIDVNEVSVQKLGFDRQDLIGREVNGLAPKRLKVELTTQLKNFDNDNEELIFSTEFVDITGRNIFVECHAKLINYGGRKVILNVIRDISERMQTQKALLTVLNSIQGTIYVCDIENSTILFMNEYMKNLIDTDLIGERCDKISNFLGNSCKYCSKKGSNNKTQDFKSLPPWEAQHRINKKWFLHYDKFIDWIDGRPVKMQIAFDITDIKELTLEKEAAEDQLRKIQRMEAIGTLAGGVAHDLNNILSGIVSLPDLLLVQTPKGSPIRGPLKTIRESGLKASATVSDLLTLARRGVIVNEVVNINDVISDYLGSPEHRRLIDHHQSVDIEQNLHSNLLHILGSPIHLFKTIMNLVTNAAEAIQGSGTISLTTTVKQIDGPLPKTPDISKGEYVVLKVSDDGCGISPKDAERLFEPFFTTKVMGRSGTGLGMAVVWGTVEDHDGYIELDSRPSQGTTFSLYFPVTRTKLLKRQSIISDINFKGNGETILIIDDVKEQRDVAVLVFSQLGYHALAVESGEEAISFLSENSIDLILLDMIMEGGMNGLETYKEILTLHPEQKAIVTTGYSKTSNVNEALEMGAGQYIKKPYLYDEIAQAAWSELAK